jgi:hypothetical protein
MAQPAVTGQQQSHARDWIMDVFVSSPIPLYRTCVLKSREQIYNASNVSRDY